MRIRSKIWLETKNGKLLLGEGRLGIFHAIDRNGSLSAAARELGMSYRAVWGKVRATEERLGIQLVERAVGGPRHGGAKLTPAGKRFVHLFEIFENRAQKTIDELAEKLLQDLKREKEENT
jgi:molybdate transport system regulatory protein